MVVRRLRYTGDRAGTYYIDLFRDLSAHERRMIRQKQIAVVHGGVYKDTDGSVIKINTAPDNWVTKRSINRGFRAWKKMVAKTLKESEGLQSGKYSDFKICLDANMSRATSNHLMAVDAADVPILMEDAGTGTVGGEWNYSNLISEDPNSAGTVEDFTLHVVGGNTTSNGIPTEVGLIQSWFDSRPFPDQSGNPVIPADASTDPIGNMFDAGDVHDDRVDSIDAENDMPPYNEQAHFGSNRQGGGLQRQSIAESSTGAGAVVPVHGFTAICGLLQVEIGATDAWELILDVDTKGVKF